MSRKYVSRLIKEGKYSDAKYEAGMLSQQDRLFYLSRISELNGKFDQALKYANQAATNAKSSDDKLQAAIAQAYAFWRLFLFDEGHAHLNEVYHIVEEKEFEPDPLRGTFFNIRGLLYWKSDKLQNAFDDFEEALVIRKEIGDPYTVSYTLNNLGNTYLKYKDYPKAKHFYNEAFGMRNSLGHDPAIAASYNSFGRYLDAIGNHEEAKVQHEQSLKIWKKVDNLQFIAKSHRFLAINAWHRGHKMDNEHQWQLSDDLFDQIPNPTDKNTNDKLQLKFTIKV